MWIRRLGEERFLSRGEPDIGWRKHARPRPRHLGDAILVEQGPALVVGSPRGCSVHHRLGEQHDRPRRYLRNDDAGGLFGGLVDLSRQLEVTLVAPGNAPESAMRRSGFGKAPGRDHESLVDAVGGKVKALSWLREGVESRSPVVRVHGPHGLPLVHADPVKTVQPKAVPEPKAKNRHDRLVIQQATERLPPGEEAVIRSVLAGGGAEADALARAGELLRVDQPIQLGHLRRPEDVVDHQVALKIEKVLLQLPVRIAHGYPSSREATVTDTTVTSMSPRGRRSTTTSPARLPSRARATGDATLICLAGSTSLGPTISQDARRPSASSTVTLVPNPTHPPVDQRGLLHVDRLQHLGEHAGPARADLRRPGGGQLPADADPARIGSAPGPRALHRVQETVGRINQLRRRAALHAEIPARGVGRTGLDTNQPAVLDDRDAPGP